jgi:hypothetical protein
MTLELKNITLRKEYFTLMETCCYTCYCRSILLITEIYHLQTQSGKTIWCKKTKTNNHNNGIGWRFINKQKYVEVQGLSIKNNEMCTSIHTTVFANLYVSLL